MKKLLVLAFVCMFTLASLTMDMPAPEDSLDDYGVARWVSHIG